ncbi:hypothetical protein P0F65_09500 [Sphingomonas sp. I4]
MHARGPVRAGAGVDGSVPEQHCAFQTIRLGHYIGDGSQPLHNSVNSDGWRGPNPNGYTRDRSIHGRFESGFVDAIGLTPADIMPRIGPSRTGTATYSTPCSISLTSRAIGWRRCTGSRSATAFATPPTRTCVR